MALVLSVRFSVFSLSYPALLRFFFVSALPSLRLLLLPLFLCALRTLKGFKEENLLSPLPRNGIRRRPTLPGRLQPSTIGVLRLNFCVRNGNRWNPQAITTAKGERIHQACNLTTAYELLRSIFIISKVLDQLNQAIDRLVSSSYTHYCASTDDLSTW